VSPKLRTLLPRIILIGGVLGVGAVMAPQMPHEQGITVRLGNRQVARVSGVVTKLGDAEPTAGFSQDFSGRSPRSVRHEFSAPNGTYIVVITFTDKPDAANRQGGTGALPTNQQGGAAAPPTNQQGGAGAPPTNQQGVAPPNQPETTFERRVSLVGGEVTVSPD
jgi:hypothetical protein